MPDKVDFVATGKANTAQSNGKSYGCTLERAYYGLISFVRTVL